jgi:hypothetical protein
MTNAEKAIDDLNGKTLEDSREPLVMYWVDTEEQRLGIK